MSLRPDVIGMRWEIPHLWRRVRLTLFGWASMVLATRVSPLYVSDLDLHVYCCPSLQRDVERDSPQCH